MSHKIVLHVGAGHRGNGAILPAAYASPEWREVRLDIDPNTDPDIIGSITDMKAITDSCVDAVFSSHNIEHVYAHEVQAVLNEFLRVVKPEGTVLLTCPDLQRVCELVAQDRLTEPAYMSLAGPITPLDIIFGHSAALAAGRYYMAHKGGFTLKSLTEALRSAGFQIVAGERRNFDLWVVAKKPAATEADTPQNKTAA